jgi:CRP-like cAMP-binding protein
MTLTHSATDLRRFPEFAQLPRRARAMVGSLTTLVSFPEGRVICREGELGREAFVLVSGTAAVSRDGAPVAVLGAGEVVGEGALLGDGRRNATVTATSDVTALVMSIREFNTLLTLPGVNDAIRGLQTSRDAA